MAATFQSAIASMKAREKELSESLRAAELRAEENLRILETIAREMPGGLMIFNRERLIALSNSAVRSLLGIDTWSRRRYGDILGRETQLAGCIRECLEAGRVYRRETMEYRTPGGETLTLEIPLAPLLTRNGHPDGAVCLLMHRTMNLPSDLKSRV